MGELQEVANFIFHNYYNCFKAHTFLSCLNTLNVQTFVEKYVQYYRMKPKLKPHFQVQDMGIEQLPENSTLMNQLYGSRGSKKRWVD